MNIDGLISFGAIFLPFFSGLFLLISRLKLYPIKKSVLENLSIISSLGSLACFIFLKSSFLFKDLAPIKLTFFNIENFFTNEDLSFSIYLDNFNLNFLIFSSLIALILSIFHKFYFKKKKHFIFTKQRFYIFSLFLFFLNYMFFASYNLFESLIFLILQGSLIFVFSYFDVFKNFATYNISRNEKINIIGDFLFLFGLLILFKCSILSKGYISACDLNFPELNMLVSYGYGIIESYEFKICAICLLGSIFIKFLMLPFNCYFSFSSNSSGVTFLNNISFYSLGGYFLFLKFLPMFDFISNFYLILGIIAFLTLITSSIFILFEKDIKIISGYFYSIINSILLLSFSILRNEKILFLFFIFHFILIILLSILIYKDKLGFKKRLINKQKGFILERIFILFLENLPEKIFKFFNFLNEKIIKNILILPLIIFDFCIKLFNAKTLKRNIDKIIIMILSIFALFALLSIFIELLGGI